MSKSTIIEFIIIGYFVYAFQNWHYMFLYLVPVFANWIYLSEKNIETIFQKITYALFVLYCLCLLVILGKDWMWQGYSEPVINYLYENENLFKNSTIYFYPTDSNVLAMIPEFKNRYNITFLNPHSLSYSDYRTYVDFWSRARDIFYFDEAEKYISQLENTDKIYLIIDKESYHTEKEKEFLQQAEEKQPNLNIIHFADAEHSAIYKIEKKE